MLDKLLIQANTLRGFLQVQELTRVKSVSFDAEAMVST